MKKIKYPMLVSSIKEAYREGHKYASLHSEFTYTIMLDTDNGRIWCDCFMDCNTWKDYHSDTIVRLIGAVGAFGQNEVIKNYAECATDLLRREGWGIEE